MSSEEDKRKIKHKAVRLHHCVSLFYIKTFTYLQQKLEHRQSKLRQQNSLQLSNPLPAPTLSRSDSIHSLTGNRNVVSQPTMIAAPLSDSGSGKYLKN